MELVAKKSRLPIFKSLKDGIKKTVKINNEGNYVIEKQTVATGESITTILNSDVFEIQEIVDFFTNY